MNELSELIVSTIDEIKRKKDDEHRAPNFALYQELKRALSEKIEIDAAELKTELNALIRSGVVVWGNTINDKWLRVRG